MGRRKKVVEEAPKPEPSVSVAENAAINVSPAQAGNSAVGVSPSASENPAVNVLAQIIAPQEQKN